MIEDEKIQEKNDEQRGYLSEQFWGMSSSRNPKKLDPVYQLVE